jgi:hypothetical protein
MEQFRRDLATTISTESSRQRATIEHEYRNAFSGAAVTLDPAAVARLRGLSYVSRVTYDVPVRASVEPGVAAVRAPEVWTSLGTRGAGMTVAIIDTGVDYLHPALGGGFGPGFKVIGGHDFVNADADPMDDNDHGTHVAGTVAANSAELLGVAPDAKLVAFKVLDAQGQGWMSNIIAAIERCVDPNGDGDFSDRVDVANMSLGGPGHPDDAPSRAVDAAVEAGVVFVIAAGNGGYAQTIGSPGTADRAITVGAVDLEGAIAFFSSRGPAALRYSIKPDVVAPGMNVLSTKRGGGTWYANGTSMAAPHVAGVAALLRALHPGWTVARIKSALVSTGQGADLGAMTGGSGRVDAVRAATASTEVQPSSLSFGVTDGITPRWTQSRTVSVTNDGNAIRTYTAIFSGTREGISLMATPPELTLAPGQSGSIEVTVDVDHTTLPFPRDGSLSFGGLLELDSAGHRLRVPWAFAKGVRLHVKYTGEELVNVVLGHPSLVTPVMPVGENAFETLIEPGLYDVAVLALPFEGGEPALVMFEKEDIRGDRRYDVEYADAPYLIDFSARDEAGVPLTDFPRPGGCARLRTIELPRGIGGMQFASFEGWFAFRSGTLSSEVSLFASDACMDQTFSRVYGIQHEPVRGVAESMLRVSGGSELVAQKFEMFFPLPANAERLMSFGTASYIRGTPAGLGAQFIYPFDTRRWSGMAYVTREYGGTVQYLPGLTGGSRGAGQDAQTTTQPLRVTDRRMSTFAGATVPPTAYHGDLLSFGAGAVVPRLEIVPDGPTYRLHPRLAGQLDETRKPGIPLGQQLVDDAGAPVGEYVYFLAIGVDDLDRKLTYTADGITHEIDGVVGRTWLTMRFGGPQTDKLAPQLTSLLLRDAAGRRQPEHITRDGLTRLTFSAHDSEALDEAKTTLRIRRTRHGEWTTLPLTVKGRDQGTPETLGRDPRGTIFEAELRLSDKGHYDLEMQVEDRSGNVTAVLMEPALAVVDGRGRAVRH